MTLHIEIRDGEITKWEGPMPKFPGWRTMTGAQRHNARQDAIMDSAYELAARKAGWAPNGPHGKWVLAGDANYSQGTYVPTERACRNICADHDLLGLRS